MGISIGDSSNDRGGIFANDKTASSRCLDFLGDIGNHWGT
jgi:hypothetical protein